jgi:hypothetical protein
MEAGKAAPAIEDGEAAGGILVHAHGGADIVVAMTLRRNLEAASVEGHAIEPGPSWPLSVRRRDPADAGAHCTSTLTEASPSRRSHSQSIRSTRRGVRQGDSSEAREAIATPEEPAAEPAPRR